MFKEDGNVIHFAAPKGLSPSAAAFLLYFVLLIIPPLGVLLCSRNIRSQLLPQFTPRYHLTPSPSTATAKTKNSQNSSLVSSISSVLTAWRLSENWRRATKPCRRRMAVILRRMTMTISRTWWRGITSKAGSNKNLDWVENERSCAIQCRYLDAWRP